MSQQGSMQRELLQNLAKAMGMDASQVNVMEVVRQGTAVIIPEGANIPEVIEVLDRQHKAEQQKVTVKADLAVPPWDGAFALDKAMKEELGVVVQNSDFWTGAAGEVEVEVEIGKTVNVRWGEFTLTGMGTDAVAKTGVTYDAEKGQWVFTCIIVCRRKYQDRAKKILARMREIASQESLHKGKAFSMRYHDDDGDRIAIPKPRFFPLDVEQPIFRAELERSIERNVFTPLRHADKLVKMGEPLKRGVLFAGRYGVGKTMLASYIARVAVAQGWTFMYVKDCRDLPLALKEAQRFGRTVVFGEDVDRVAGPERTNAVNDLLNQLDGIDSKASQIMTILTSNSPERINAAMKRAGRIDLMLQVLPPDADAVGRLAIHYGRGSIDPEGKEFLAMCKLMAGQSPSDIREVVARARLESVRRTGKEDARITGADLHEVAQEVQAERDLFRQDQVEARTDLAPLATAFEYAGKGLRGSLAKSNGTASVQ